MILNKALLIKGLAGLTTIAATATPLALNWNKIFKKPTSPGGGDATDQTSTIDATALITAVGLSCGTPSSSGTDCSMSSTTESTVNLNVKKETSKSDGITAISSSTGGTEGKIRLYSEDTTNAYKSGLKFVIEGGDVTLTGGSETSISKLEEFETYQIEEEGTGQEKKYYLSRKEKAADEIKRTLGLPEDCSFPESDNATKNCSISEEEKLKAINFEGKSGAVTISSGSSLTLTITKVSDTTNYPLGYKFSFTTTGSNDVTVSTTTPNTPITFRPNSPVDFKIEKEGNNGKDLKLKKNLTLNTLLSEVGLSGCTTENNNECTIGTTGLNVKQDSNQEEGRTKDTSSSGKIKVYSDTSYSNNFKFVIEDGDISFTNSGTVSKLEQFETYEIKAGENGNSGKYFLTKKTKAADGIKTALGLPESCDLSSDNGCTNVDIDSNNIKKIKFDGLSESQEPSFNGSSKLTVSKETTTDSDFPFGYKFTFKAETTDATVTAGSKNITIKATNGTEFRIKKPATGNNITLEEAWSLDRLLEKVGLSGCTVSGTTECTIGELGIKVKQDSNPEENKKKSTDSSTGKIKVYSDTTYNKGFKFVIEEGDISLTGGSGTVNKLEQFETYEIKKDSDKWYLTRNKKASESIKDSLGLPTDCNLPEGANASELCCDITVDKLKTINFEGKNTSGTPTIDESGTPKLKITKTNDTTTYPNGGYKFVFETDKNISIPGTSTNPITIKKNTNTEFKIKVTPSSGTTPVSLSLEKAWTVTELVKKLGITTCDTNSKTCDLTNSINVWFGSNDKIDNASITATGKKLKYEEDQENHNQGFKFTVDEEITLNSESNKKIENSNTSYEIKEQTEGNETKWYLSKVTTPAA